MMEKSISQRILLVEDDLSLSRGLHYALEKEGFLVDAAFDAAGCRSLYETAGYSLILLDVGLPDGNGFDLFGSIRKSNNTPVIFLTACDQEVNVVMGLDMGADDYICKPFRINELISRIRAVLRRTAPAFPPRSEYNDGIFILDPEGSRLRKNGVDLQLTVTELRLISMLIINRGSIVTREKLIEQLWDCDERWVDSNTLSVYIRRLREKIEDYPSNPVYIKTVRGIGYQWK